MRPVVFASLQWTVAPMPGSNAPVQLARLPNVADGAFRAFVRFPAGWRRPGTGHYPVAEEILILEGDLRLNDHVWRAGGYAWIPAGRTRSQSRSDSGCLAFAWFASAPRWVAGEPAGAAPCGDVAFAHWRDAPGGRLYSAPEHRTWIAKRRQAAMLAASWMRCETLDLRDRTWRPDAGHEAGDDPAQAVLLRVRSLE